MSVKGTLRDALKPRRLGIRARFILLFYLVTLLSLGLVGYYGYISSVDAYLRMAEAQVKEHTDQVSQKISDFLDLTRSDLGYFSSHHDLLRNLYWLDVGEAQKHDLWHAVTLDSWRDFVRSYDYLYKVRFLDLKGRERIAIRRDPRTREVRALGEVRLQDKSRKGYFLDALELERGGITATPLDLNREHGKVERPLVPVVRLAQAVFGQNQVRYGVVVISLFADAFFDYIREANQRIKGGTLYLINEDGDFLFHPDSAKSFGHLLGHGANFRGLFPGALESLRMREEGTLFETGHVLGFKRLYPLAGDREHYWILVGAVDGDQVLGELTTFKYLFFSILIGTLVLVFIVSRHYLDNLLRPLLAATRQVQRLGRGEIVREAVGYATDDEIGRMLESTDRLIANMEALSERVDAIAAGDFSSSVAVLSERDRLGEAINNMTRMLRENQEESERRIWLQDGIARLNQTLSSELEPAELADRAVAFLGRYLDAGHGVIYLFDEQEKILELLASYMFTEHDQLNRRLRPGQGTVGQVARECRPILLSDIPPGEREVSTGTLKTTPVNTYTLPLLYEEELLGVLELAGLRPFSEQERQFMEQAAATVGAFLYSALQRRRIRELLSNAEQASLEAQERSRQLQEANARLEDQQGQLQQQTEELQKANAHMEEQQQQLQQQTEELQQTNAHMEEQQQQLEQQAREMERQNRDLLASRESMDLKARELEQANRYKSEFLANMSHELRTPLNSIILLSRMLQMNEDGKLGAEEVKRAGVIHHAGEELLRLINDILDMSKIEAGKMELHPQLLHSADLAGEYAEMFQDLAAQKGLEFRVEDELQADFSSDRDKLSQIVRNLLSNAFKFTREGSVTLRLEANDDPRLPLRIAVNDTGIGIPEAKRQLIFEAFQQVDGSVSREYGGTGLGLSISLRFARLLGGDIEVQSTPGEGSRFSLLLPEEVPGTREAEPASRAAGPQPIADFPAVEPAADDRDDLQASDQVILLIDDDPAFAESVLAANRGFGYKTLIAHNAEEGLRMARSYRPRGILLDLGLPDRDGSEVLHELKSTRELRDIPIHIVSARDRDDGRLLDGIAGYLQKPVDDRQLRDAEARTLGLGTRVAGHILVLEGASLQTDQVQRLLGDGAVRLQGAGSPEEALDLLRSRGFDLAILDLGSEDGDVEAVLETCRALREQAPELGILFCGERQPTADEDIRLREFSDSIILNAPQAGKRLSENIERFLRDMPKGSAQGRVALPGGEATPGKKLEGRHILVVDDDPRNLFVVTSALEQQGARVDNALNGRKALEMLRKRPVDLLILDIMMPEMDGYATIKALKEDPDLRAIPIVALTAKALKQDRETVIAAGADDYLSKPVDYEMLVNMAAIWSRGGP